MFIVCFHRMEGRKEKKEEEKNRRVREREREVRRRKKERMFILRTYFGSLFLRKKWCDVVCKK